MLKRCEECGYPYSSFAEKCPRCACPNPHIHKTRNLLSKQETEKDEISKSILCIVVFIGLTWAFHKWGHLEWVPSMWMAGFVSCLFISPGSGVFILLFVLAGCGMFLGQYMPPFYDEVSFYLVTGIIIYYMLIRPFIKIYKIRKNEEEIIQTHTNANPNARESYASQDANPTNVVDVEFIERNEE